MDQSRETNGGVCPTLLFTPILEEKNINLSPTILKSAQNPMESDINSATTFRVDQYPGITNKEMPFPMSLQFILLQLR